MMTESWGAALMTALVASRRVAVKSAAETDNLPFQNMCLVFHPPENDPFVPKGVSNIMSMTDQPQTYPRPPLSSDMRLAAPRVLVVEDEMTVAMLIEDMVSELDYEVAAVVPRLEDAMRLLDSESFDIAMLDVHLNGKTVFPFAAELESREVPFLFATAYGSRGIPAEFQGHIVLQKPFGPVELRRALLDLAGAAQ
jgi:CheY-like chemotaxis protein